MRTRTLLKIIIGINAIVLALALVGFFFNLITDYPGFAADILIK